MNEDEFRKGAIPAVGVASNMKNPYKKPSAATLCSHCGAAEGVPHDASCLKVTEQRAGSVRGYDDPVNHPAHYTAHPSGVECITVTEHMNFNVGNAIKYLWRAGLKTGAQAAESVGNEQHVQDLRKAQWYITREIERLSNGQR